MRCDGFYLKGLLNHGAAGVHAKYMCLLLCPIYHDIFQPMLNNVLNLPVKAVQMFWFFLLGLYEIRVRFIFHA